MLHARGSTDYRHSLEMGEDITPIDHPPQPAR